MLWLNEYLTLKFQYVHINNQCSDVLPVLSGVPQGSILGPMLSECPKEAFSAPCFQSAPRKHSRPRAFKSAPRKHSRPHAFRVLQGSILGPLLFIIYANDIPDIISHSKLFLYADDTKILTSIKSPSYSLELQEDLTALGSWSDQWKLSFNSD